jgi:hypothetical protein
MNSLGIKSLLILFVFTPIMFCEEHPYYGLKITMKASTLLKDNLFLLNEVLGTFKGTSFAVLNETAGEGIGKQGLTLQEIITNDGISFDEKSLSGSYSLEDNIFTYDSATDAFSMTFQFKWDFQFLGVHWMFGTGTATIDSTNLKIVQNLQSGYPVTEVKLEWNFKEFDLVGLWDIGYIQDWIEKMLNERFLTHFSEEIDNRLSLIDNTIFLPYQNIAVRFGDHLEMSILNTIAESGTDKKGADQLFVLGFHTNITVDNRPYNKALWKKTSSDESTFTGDFGACLNYEIITAMLEVMGKSRFFYHKVDLKSIGLTNELGSFLDIVPELENIYPGNEEVEMGCRTQNGAEIIDIREKDHPAVHKIQVPLSCMVTIKDKGYDFLQTDAYLRFKYEAKHKDDAFYGVLSEGVVYDFKIHDRHVNTPGLSQMLVILDSISKEMNGDVLIDATLPISVHPLRHLSFRKAQQNTNEVCFYYAEPQ